MARTWREVLEQQRGAWIEAWAAEGGAIPRERLEVWLGAFSAEDDPGLPAELPLAARVDEAEVVAELLGVRDRLLGELGHIHPIVVTEIRGRADTLLLAYLRERDRRRSEARALDAAEAEHDTRARRFAVVGQMAGGVAHTFNNLLTVASGYASALEMGDDLSPLQQRAIQRITDATNRAGELSQNLARTLRGVPTRAEAVPVLELLAEVRDLLGVVLGRSVELEVLAQEGLPPLRADRARLTESLLHLVANAREAMPSGGQLKLTARRAGEADDGPFVVLEVGDTGVGIAEDDLARVFEPGFSTRDRDDAAGLGLARVKTIVEEEGGRVEIDSAPGAGTTVRLWWPIA